MKRITTKVFAVVLVASMPLIWLSNCNPPKATSGQVNVLPQDAMDVFPLTRDVFRTWFVNDSITENGAVNPANSLEFSPQNNVDFYKWSAQMFLWITSPVSDGTVMESPVFYTVTPDSSGYRRLIPHQPGVFLKATSNLRLSGPKGFVLTRDGKKLTLVSEKTVLNSAGREVRIGRIITSSGGTHSFLDESGREILHPKPVFKKANVRLNHAAMFESEGKVFFMDAEGNEIETDEGQATGDGLISKNGSIVYYITMVNDVYVQFLKETMTRTPSPDQFPTTQAALDSIISFVKRGGLEVPQDTIALAMELKTSWVTAESLGADSSDYIIISAEIPVYNTASNETWVPEDSTTIARLALVGMHVVGSAKGHPEMIWATFEHQRNSPNATYPYVDVKGNVKNVPQDTGDNWLLSSNASDSMPNVSHIAVSGDTMKANSPFNITPSNTLRINPFGSFSIIDPNPHDSPASSNSKVISLNNSLQKMLVGNDTRKNYYLIGATWTGGQAPNGNSYLGTPNDSLAVGTSQLANSTMETYVLPINYANPDNTFGLNMSCFSCHFKNGLKPDDLSHVFVGLQAGLTLPK